MTPIEATAVFESVWNDLESDDPTRAQNLATGLADAIDTAFSSALVNITVTGTIPGVPPVPYSGVEPPFAGVFDKSILVDGIAQIESLFGNGAGVAATYSLEEAGIYANAIYDYVTQASYLMTLHTGLLSITAGPAVTMQTTMAALFTVVYSVPDPSPSAVTTKAVAVSAAIATAVTTWLATITFSGTVVVSPGGPLAPGTGTGLMV